MKSKNGKQIYFLGIIDILTEYNTFKKFEFVTKMIYYCSNKMSCVPPSSYKDRFLKYITNRFVDDENLK